MFPVDCNVELLTMFPTLKKVCRDISDLISKILTMFISLDASLHVYSTEE
jgi:hypothetical protein